MTLSHGLYYLFVYVFVMNHNGNYVNPKSICICNLLGVLHMHLMIFVFKKKLSVDSWMVIQIVMLRILVRLLVLHLILVLVF
jgi:hypothetical protein